LALGALAALLVVGAITRWLPGPRAALPSPSPAAGGSFLVQSGAGLPDPKRTPGTINPDVTQANVGTTVCQSGWAQAVRPPRGYTNALKLAQLVQYGYSDRDPSHYEEDHLVPLELGGAPRDPANLWPEPRTLALADGTTVGSDAKDRLEDYLHMRVCAGTMALDEAQRLIANNWIAAWDQAGRP
jgi:hypothetical protein